MAFITLSTLVTDPFVAALCNTLVHSLWQGLVLAALTGSIIIFTRKASAATRYNLLIAALVLFAVGVSVTFVTEFKQANVATAIPATTMQQLPLNMVFTPILDDVNTPIVTTSFSDWLFSYLNNNHNTIVLIWFLIICAKSIQLGFGLWGVNRLKTRQVSAASMFWNDRINQLANSLAIQQTIRLLESGLTKVPMVIGNLKPVILMPIGLLTALTTAEVEAILVHELAHIKRRDYLVNLLQSLMEIVFFFNPAVLWISQLIKAERENCCDDLALAQSSDKASYVRALLSCEEYQQSVPAYAMAFPGGKGSLFDRVKRIAGNRNHSLNLFEKTVLAVCLVVSGLCMSAFAEKENIKRAAHAVVTAIQHIKGEAVPSPQSIAKQTKMAEDQEIQQVNPLILTAEMPTLHDAVKLQRPDIDTTLNSKLGSLNTLTGGLGTLNPRFADNDTTKKYRSSHRDWVDEMLKDGLIKSRTGNSTSINEKEFVINGVKQPEDVHKKYLAMAYFRDPIKLFNDSARLFSGSKARTSAAIDEMLKDGLAKERATLSFSMSDTAFILNGVKQPKDVHKKYFEMMRGYQYKPIRLNINTDVKTNINTDVKLNILPKVNTDKALAKADVKTKLNLNFDTTVKSTLTYNKNINPKTDVKLNYKSDLKLNSKRDFKLDTVERNINALKKLKLKLYIPKMGDALYDAGLIKDKGKFTALITNDILLVNGVKQSEENHQLILKKYQKKPGDKVNLSFTYPGK
jgi:bla regulator protein BlaR1